ncbi:hypothetical protein [Coleofasciculus sp. FACHB-542]|nr:hypothetical protein [Coleofasciculus sp. FACHB-542]MBD2083930.1 hypothetical protein [Coleofasciculus sp. FACHB-542]
MLPILEAKQAIACFLHPLKILLYVQLSKLSCSRVRCGVTTQLVYGEHQ